MKGLDCNKVKIFINLEIIGEKDKYKKLYLFFKNSKKKILQFSTTTTYMPNFYYIVYVIYTTKKNITQYPNKTQ